MTELIFYKDQAGWKYIKQDNRNAPVGTFINPLPDYKIKHIYYKSGNIIVLYWPVKLKDSIDQKVLLLGRYNYLNESVPNIKLQKLDEVLLNIEKSCFLRTNEEAYYICTLNEKIEYIRHDRMTFFVMKSRIINFGYRFTNSSDYQSFQESQFDFNSIINIDVYNSSLFVSLVDDRIWCDGWNYSGQLGQLYNFVNCKPQSTNFVDQRPIQAETNKYKLKKISCGLCHTLFWYELSGESVIYISGSVSGSNTHAYQAMRPINHIDETFYSNEPNFKPWLKFKPKIYKDLNKVQFCQSHDFTYAIVFQYNIEIKHHYDNLLIKFDSPIKKVHLNFLLYVMLDNGSMHIYEISHHSDAQSTKISSVAKKIDQLQNIVRPVQWFNTLPFAHDHWDILCVLFAGHYKCTDSPLSKTKLPMDLLKIIINALIDLY